MSNSLRAARLAAGLTQLELAERTGLSHRTIWAMEDGRPCRQRSKRLILKALGIDWPGFWEGEATPPVVEVRDPTEGC